MRINRAKEILNSSDNIEVLYKSNPIWIKNVNETNYYVEVKDLKDNTTFEVHANDLTESRNKMKM